MLLYLLPRKCTNPVTPSAAQPHPPRHLPKMKKVLCILKSQKHHRIHVTLPCATNCDNHVTPSAAQPYRAPRGHTHPVTPGRRVAYPPRHTGHRGSIPTPSHRASRVTPGVAKPQPPHHTGRRVTYPPITSGLAEGYPSCDLDSLIYVLFLWECHSRVVVSKYELYENFQVNIHCYLWFRTMVFVHNLKNRLSSLTSLNTVYIRYA